MNFKTELTKQIFKSKYSLESEDTPDQAVDRIIKVIKMYYPDKANDIEEYIHKKWLLPAGGIWRAAENPNKNVSVINCTTLEPPTDDLESIFDSFYWWAKYAAFGQGEGIDLSKLRPRGAAVHNSSRSSTGAVSFMKIYDSILQTIAQQGRRGASLISLSISHPDIPEFIYVKDKEGVLESANISIQATDDFMKKVYDKDAVWEFTFKNMYETIKKEIKASELFDMICEHAWKSGDPGLQFIDTMRKYSNSDVLGYPIVSTNAPVIGTTKVPTENGIFPIQELYDSQKTHKVLYNSIVEKDSFELSKQNSVSVENSKFVDATFNKYANQQIVDVYLNGYGVIHCNKEHKWFTAEGYKRAIDLQENDRIISFPNGIYDTDDSILKDRVDMNSDLYKEGVVCGWLTGDGWFGTNYNGGKVTENKNVGFIFRKGYEGFLEVFNSMYKRITGTVLNYVRDRGSSLLIRSSSTKFANYLNETYGYDNNKYHVPQKAFTDINFAIGFLQGLFQTDGYVSKLTSKGRVIVLVSTDKKLCEDVQQLLLMWFGIKSSIKDRESKGVSYVVKETGEEKVSNFKQAYSLSITSMKNLYKFFSSIGFLYGDKKEIQQKYLEQNLMEKLDDQRTPNYLYYIVDKVVVTDEYADMYCANIPEYHSLNIGGLVSSNCSEQPLDSHNICMLSSINLAGYKNEYDTYDYVKLIESGVYMLDSFRLYELEKGRSPNKVQQQKLVDIPRIGLGVTGLADFFIRSKIAYGSKESIRQSKDIFSALAQMSYVASYDIAKRNGKSFPAYNKEKYKQSFFIRRMLDEGIVSEKVLSMQAHVAKITIAPNGCILSSTLIQTDKGNKTIEEIFAYNKILVEEHKNEKGRVFNPINALQVKTLYGYKKIKKLYINGFAKTIQAKTKNGRSIEGTHNHKILVKKNNTTAIWKRLDEIKKGDIVLIQE